MKLKVQPTGTQVACQCASVCVSMNDKVCGTYVCLHGHVCACGYAHVCVQACIALRCMRKHTCISFLKNMCLAAWGLSCIP